MSVAVDLASGFLTYAEAGRELGITRQAVHKLARSGRLARITMHGRDYVTVTGVRARKRMMVEQGLLPVSAAERG